MLKSLFHYLWEANSYEIQNRIILNITWSFRGKCSRIVSVSDITYSARFYALIKSWWWMCRERVLGEIIWKQWVVLNIINIVVLCHMCLEGKKNPTGFAVRGFCSDWNFTSCWTTGLLHTYTVAYTVCVIVAYNTTCCALFPSHCFTSLYLVFLVPSQCLNGSSECISTFICELNTKRSF